MTKRYSRWDALLTGAALLTLPAASRAFTFGERDQWEDYAGLSSRASSYSGMSGTAGGFEYPGGSGRRNAYVFFDPQDPVSIRLCRHVSRNRGCHFFPHRGPWRGIPASG